MKPGPCKKPTAVEIAEGRPSHRPLPKNEPKPKEGNLTIPSILGKEGRAEWKRIMDAQAKGLITIVDRGILTAYCRSWEEFFLAASEVDKVGRYFQTDKGNVVQHPAVSLMNKASLQMNRYAQELGLTPAARARIEMPDAPAGSEESGESAEEFLNQGLKLSA